MAEEVWKAPRLRGEEEEEAGERAAQDECYRSEVDGSAREEEAQPGAVPAYLFDRETTARAKVLSNTIKQKRKEKAGKWEVPLPKVRPQAEDELFRVLRSGKRKQKSWKRMVTKVRISCVTQRQAYSVTRRACCNKRSLFFLRNRY